MNRAHVHYMDLLTALARQDLLDARQAFDRLLAAGTQKDHLPYLLHIASCIAATQEGREVAPLLAQSATRLLDALASAREKTEGKSVRADMRKALLVQEHKVQVSPLGKDKYSKYVDFFARALLSDSPRYPAQASLIAARELQRNGLWPSGRELKDAGLSRQRADKFKTLERKASRPMGEFPQTQADLAVAARELKKLDLSGARAADAEQRAQEAEQKAAQQREDAANMAIIGAVRSAIDERWEPLARAARKELDAGPLPISAMLDPVATAAYAGAANSIPRTAPGRLVESVRDALMSTPEGKAVLQSLTRTGQPYRKEEQLEFDRALQGMVDARVGETLEGFERGLRASADKTIAESAARDAAVQARRKGEEDAALALDGARVRANAARALESRSGALSPARGESQAGRQGQAGQTTAPPQRQAEAQPSASEAELRERYENLRRADIEYQLSKLPSPPSGDPRDDAIEQRLANLRGTYNSEALVASMPNVPDTPIGNDRTRTAVPVEESGMTAAHW